MPSVEVKNLKQKAVLWPANGYDRHGEPQRGTAVEINVRWEEADQESLSATEAPIATPVTVYVDRAIAVDSTLWLGELADLPAGTADLDDLFIVTACTNTPDIKGRIRQRTVSAIRQ